MSERNTLVSSKCAKWLLFSTFSTKSNEGPQMSVNTHGNGEKRGIHSTNPLSQGEAPKKDNNNAPSKPLVGMTKEEVQAWFLHSDDFKEFASRFPLSGKHLAGLTEAQFQKPLGDIQGSALYNAVQALKGEKDLVEIIDEVYKRKPEWKCILDVPEKPPVDVDLQWVGREKELAQLRDFAIGNISSFLLQTQTKQRYRIPLVHGGLGVGKSRLVVHSNRTIEQNLKLSNPTFALRGPAKEPKHFTELFEHVGHIFIDFSVKDQLTDNEVNHEYSSSIIGLRIASHFFFGARVEELVEVLSGMNATSVIKKFTLDEVLLLISKQYASQKAILLTLQLDEFSQVPLPILRGIISSLAVHMISNHHLRVCILPQLSGTSTEIVMQGIQNFSKIVPTPLLLSPLSRSPDMTELTESALRGTGSPEPTNKYRTP